MRSNSNRRGRSGHHHGHHRGNGGNGGNNGGNNGRKPASVRYQTFESKGFEVKVRGNPYQIYEKYMALARDAMSSGDIIRAESHFQHAEHFFRLQNSEPRPQQNAEGMEGESMQSGEAVVETLTVAPSQPPSDDNDPPADAA